MAGRGRLGAALVAILVLGVASRRIHLGLWVWDKSLGDVLYAAAAYVMAALALPRSSVRRTALISLGFCVAVEFFQATGIPARYGHLALVRWVIGTQFSWHDIACYVVGVAVIAWLDGALLRQAIASQPAADN